MSPCSGYDYVTRVILHVVVSPDCSGYELKTLALVPAFGDEPLYPNKSTFNVARVHF